MGYVFRQDGINTLVMQVNGVSGVVYEGLTSVQKSAAAIAGRDDWQGQKATAVKDYVKNAHGLIIASIGMLMKDLYDQAMLYQKGYKEIDGDAHAVISENELTELKTRLNQMAPVFDSLDTEAQSIVRSVSRIGSIPYADLNGLPEKIKTLAGQFDTLDTSIRDHESDFQSRFETEREMIAALKAMISEARGTNLETYSNSALANSKNYQKLVLCYQKLAAAVESNAGDVEKAEACFQETYKVLEREYQERVEKAKKAKFWTAVTTAVISTVIIVGTGGAGTALVVGVGFASGAINAGVGSYYDQQIGSVGYPGSVNWGQVFLDSGVGGIIGGATSYVGAGFSSMAEGATFMEKMLIDGTKTVTVGMIERGGNTMYHSISEGKSLSEIIYDTKSAILDPDQVLKDFTGGCAGSAVSQGIGKASDKIGDKLFGSNAKLAQPENAIQVTKAKSPFLHQAYDVVSDTLEETGKGIGKRFAGTLAEKRDFSAALDSAFDGYEIATDAATTFASSTAATVTSDVKTHTRARMQEAQEKIDKVQEKVDGETAFHNDGGKTGKGNAAVCKDRGLDRNEVGTPDYKDSGHMAAETVVEQVVTDPSASTPGKTYDYKNAYDKMVAEKKIDPNEYVWNGGNVIRKQKVIVNGKETIVETKYTVHHLHYDVSSGKGTFQLVESKYHTGLHHKGGSWQASIAYNKYNAGSYINSYNQAVQDAIDWNDSHSSAVSGVNQGRKSGAKTTVTPDRITGDQPLSLNNSFVCTFPGMEGG